jgi:trimeric autotransporter adhesin
MSVRDGVRRHARQQWYRRPQIVATGLAGAVSLLAVVVGLAFAYWATTDSSHPAAASATSLSAPSAATATETAATSVKIGWTNPGSQVAGAQYEVIRNPGAGQAVVCTVSAPTSSCTDSGLSAGTAYAYSVTAVLDNWVSSATTTSYSTAAVTVTYPVNNTTYGSNWTGTLAGTASAATGTSISASGVKVSVQQGSGASSCWTGSGATFTASCPNYVAAAYSAPNWTLALPSGDLTSGDTYKVTAQSTDSLSVSTTSSTVSFVYTVPPPVAGAPGASATTSYSTAPIWFDGENVTLTDTPSVNGGTPVASVTYYYCLTSNASCTTTSTANWTQIGSSTASGSSWTLTWSASSLPADGTYHVMATATNSSSVTSGPSSTSTEIGLDTTPPSVSTPSINGVS